MSVTHLHQPRHPDGRWSHAPACDFCARPCARPLDSDTDETYFTDARACGSTDGPGFYLCGRKRCILRRERLEEKQGFDAVAEHYRRTRAESERRRSLERSDG